MDNNNRKYTGDDSDGGVFGKDFHRGIWNQGEAAAAVTRLKIE